MTAQQELQEWLKQHRQLDNEVEKEHFYQNLLATLGQKDSEYFQEGLLALKESVRAVRWKTWIFLSKRAPDLVVMTRITTTTGIFYFFL